MARKVLVLDEVIAVLNEVNAPRATIDKFTKRAEQLIESKGRSTRSTDELTVASGFGRTAQRGFVELTLNDELSQMDPAKAREVGIMILEAAEAAIGDEIFITFMRDKVGIDDADKRAIMLNDLREIRQGTRGISWPT